MLNYRVSTAECAGWPSLAMFEGSRSPWLGHAFLKLKLFRFVTARLVGLTRQFMKRAFQLSYMTALAASLLTLGLPLPIEVFAKRHINTTEYGVAHAEANHWFYFGLYTFLALNFL